MVKMNENKFDIDLVFLIILLWVIVFVPFITISSSFKLYLEEVLIIFPAIRLVTKFSVPWNKLLVILSMFSIYIGMTIFINHRQNQLTEYFEILKVIKFMIIFSYFIVVFPLISKEKLVKCIHWIFVFSLIINLIHFFDFFDFTRKVLIYYDPNSLDILNFGVNSIGEPAAKRIVGTFGNPNENAIFFLLLLSFYLSRVDLSLKKWMNFDLFAFISCFLITFLTQSRTALIVLCLLFFYFVYLHKKEMKRVLLVFLMIAISILVFLSLDAISINYLYNTRIAIQQNTSFMGRLEVWNKLINEWKQQPIFGYGPNKNYLYENKIYPENEYLFFLWRYGIFGLTIFLYLIFYPLLVIKRKILNYPLLLGTFLILLITSLTNVPLFNMKFLFFFAMLYAGVILLKSNKIHNFGKC